MGPPSAAGGEQPHQRGDPLPLHRVIDEPLFFPALEQAGPPQDVQVMRQGRPGNLDDLLDLPDRHLALRLDQREKHLQPAEMGQCLEGLDVAVIGGQPGHREAGYRLHGSKYMEISNRVKRIVRLDDQIARAARVPSRMAWWTPRGATQSPAASSTGTCPLR